LLYRQRECIASAAKLADSRKLVAQLPTLNARAKLSAFWFERRWGRMLRAGQGHMRFTQGPGSPGKFEAGKISVLPQMWMDLRNFLGVACETGRAVPRQVPEGIRRQSHAHGKQCRQTFCALHKRSPRKTDEDAMRHKGHGIPRSSIVAEQLAQKMCRQDIHMSYWALPCWQIQHRLWQ